MSVSRLILNGLRNPRRAIAIITYNLLRFIGHDQYLKFIVLSRSRAGSNLVISLLNSHPHIYVDREIFSKLGGKDYRDILSRTYGKQPFYIKAKGFKIFYYHPQDAPDCGIWDALAADKEIHIIHLKRENILRTLVSRRIAGITDVWGEKTNLPAKKSRNEVKISFTKEELEQGFLRTRDWEEEADRRFKDHPQLQISYEELVNQPEDVHRKLASFLGVDAIQMETKLVKQNTRPLSETIRNFHSLKEAFSGSEWAAFFEEE